MNDSIEIQVKIESIDKEKNQIIFKPYSPEYKNKIEEYPFIAINLTSLDLTKNIADQLLKISTIHVKETIFKENNEKFLNNLDINSDMVLSKNIKTNELFSPETINTTESEKKPENEMIQESSIPLEQTELESTDIYTVVM